MLEVPIAHRLAVEEVAADSARAPARASRAAPSSWRLSDARASATSRSNSATSNSIDHGGVDAIAVVASVDPIGAAERFAQPMQRDVKAVAQLRARSRRARRRARPAPSCAPRDASADTRAARADAPSPTPSTSMTRSPTNTCSGPSASTRERGRVGADLALSPARPRERDTRRCGARLASAMRDRLRPSTARALRRTARRTVHRADARSDATSCLALARCESPGSATAMRSRCASTAPSEARRILVVAALRRDVRDDVERERDPHPSPIATSSSSASHRRARTPSSRLPRASSTREHRDERCAPIVVGRRELRARRAVLIDELARRRRSRPARTRPTPRQNTAKMTRDVVRRPRRA